MDSLFFICEKCGLMLVESVKFAGKDVPCPRCKLVNHAPMSNDEANNKRSLSISCNPTAQVSAPSRAIIAAVTPSKPCTVIDDELIDCLENSKTNINCTVCGSRDSGATLSCVIETWRERTQKLWGSFGGYTGGYETTTMRVAEERILPSLCVSCYRRSVENYKRGFIVRLLLYLLGLVCLFLFGTAALLINELEQIRWFIGIVIAPCVVVLFIVIPLTWHQHQETKYRRRVVRSLFAQGIYKIKREKALAKNSGVINRIRLEIFPESIGWIEDGWTNTHSNPK